MCCGLYVQHLQVCGELSVFLDGLLVVCHRFLCRLHPLLRLTDAGSTQIQLLSQLQLRLSGVLLQLIIHLIDGFLHQHMHTNLSILLHHGIHFYTNSSNTHQICDSFSELPYFLLQVQITLRQHLHHLLRPESSIHLTHEHTHIRVIITTSMTRGSLILITFATLIRRNIYLIYTVKNMLFLYMWLYNSYLFFVMTLVTRIEKKFWYHKDHI